MESGDKRIWDLSIQEIDYVYHNLHMNNYIYAALSVYHKSRMPLNKVIRLKKKYVPECLYGPAENIINLSLHLGQGDPGLLRIDLNYIIFHFFSRLKEVHIEEIPRVIEFLTTLAYIPVLAYKNDSIKLWIPPVVRKATPQMEKICQDLARNNIPDNFLEIIINIMKNKGRLMNQKKESLPPEKLVFKFIFAVKLLIIMCENGYDKMILKKAWQNLEEFLLHYEKKHNLSGMQYAGNIKDKRQIRYRNSLYLYGGDFFRRMGDYDTAYSWYRKDIYTEQLPGLFEFFLTDMKTCERVLCAYDTAPRDKNKRFLKKILLPCLYKLFQHTGGYSRYMLHLIQTCPDADLTSTHISDGNVLYPYAGEAGRELFLLALLYNKYINGIDYKDIYYSKYFYME